MRPGLLLAATIGICAATTPAIACSATTPCMPHGTYGGVPSGVTIPRPHMQHDNYLQTYRTPYLNGSTTPHYNMPRYTPPNINPYLRPLTP
jgi:hypothetical protein